MAVPEATEDLFKGIVFFVDDSVSAETRPSLIQDMIHRGATLCPPAPPLADIDSTDNTGDATGLRLHPRFDLGKITHIISETWEIPERGLIERHVRRREIYTVTTQWHTRSRILYLQEPSHYSPDPRMIFSGIFVSCLVEMAPSDVDQIYATVSAFGGGYRAGVTSDVTHIVTRKVEQSHFNTIDTTKLGMIFVHPQWQVTFTLSAAPKLTRTPIHRIIDCVKLQKRLPYQPYVFESADIPPPILRPEWHADPSQHPSQHMTNLLKQQAIVTPEQESAWRSVSAAGKVARVGPTGSRVFEGKKVILGCLIEVSPDFRVAIEETVGNAGGVILAEERVRECDIYVTPWREGKQYLRAVKFGKTIATLPWINHVIKVNRLTAPKDNLLHYPFPRGGVLGLKDCTISVTNYTGESRDYMKRLISAMGATFTTTLAREANTHLIAATKSGEKVARAGIWYIPVLNHLYLEDCFIKWKRLAEAGDDRYTVFPHGVNFMTLLGNAKLTDVDLEPWTAPARDIDDDDDMLEIDGHITATGVTPPTQLSEASQRDRTIRQDPTEALAGEMVMDLADASAREPTIADEAQQQTDLVGQDVQMVARPTQSDLEQDQPVPRSASTATMPQPADEAGRSLGELPHLGVPGDVRMDADVPVDEAMQNEDQADVGMDGNDEEAGGAVDVVMPGADDAAIPDVQDEVEPDEVDQAMPVATDVQVVVEPATSPISDPPPDEEEEPAALTTQAKGKGKAPAKTTKKSRPVAATTTQNSKRRRLSTPEKPEAVAPEPPVFEGRVRRQAASKAADTLHNIIAPDMALHEKEKKRKDIISPKSRRAARVGGNEEGSSRKAKEASVSAEEEPTDDETELKLQAKSTQRGGKKAAATRGRSRSTIVRDTARSQLTTRSASVLSGLSGEEEDREGDLIPSQVRLMCTGCNPDDKTSKALKSLGVRFTEKPLDMTHLIAKTAMRTHKLLVGLAKGVDVLSITWLEKCAELKRMIDPSLYILKDEDSEKKGGFVLANSIARSRELHEERGGLFAGKLFHITGRVKPDFDQIKDVVKAAGGDITRYISGKTRIPKDDQDALILISCAEDKDIWEDLLMDEYNVVVHDKELLFASILKMELNMDEHKLIA